MLESPSLRRKLITKKIHLCNYDENDEENKYKWEVDSDGNADPFFDAIVDEKKFDYYRENPMSMGGEVHVKVEDQDEKFILLYNDNIHAMREDGFYAENLQRGI